MLAAAMPADFMVDAHLHNTSRTVRQFLVCIYRQVIGIFANRQSMVGMFASRKR